MKYACCVRLGGTGRTAGHRFFRGILSRLLSSLRVLTKCCPSPLQDAKEKLYTIVTHVMVDTTAAKKGFRSLLTTVVQDEA